MNARTDDDLIMGYYEERLQSNQKHYYVESKAARCLVIFTCVVLSAIFIMLFGLTVTSMYKIQKLESQIEEMKGLLDGLTDVSCWDRYIKEFDADFVYLVNKCNA